MGMMLALGSGNGGSLNGELLDKQDVGAFALPVCCSLVVLPLAALAHSMPSYALRVKHHTISFM